MSSRCRRSWRSCWSSINIKRQSSVLQEARWTVIFRNPAISDLPIFRHPSPVSLKQLVTHRNDLIYRELRRSMRIEHHRLVHSLFFQSPGRFDRHQLDIDICPVEGSALLREVSDHRRLNPIAVNEAGDFHAGIFRKIGNEPVVQDISAVHGRVPSIPQSGGCICADIHRAGC